MNVRDRPKLPFPGHRKTRWCGVPDRRLSATTCPSRMASERKLCRKFGRSRPV